MLTIQRVNPLNIPAWDAKVALLPGATLFHSTAWARLLSTTYRYEPNYFFLEDCDDHWALLPTMGVTSWLTGKRGIGLPFTDECSPLCSDASAFKAVLEAAKQYGKDVGWKHLELRGGGSLLNGE